MRSSTIAAQSFESVSVSVSNGVSSVRIVVLYRPPPTSADISLEGFASLLNNLVLSSANLLLVGGFDFHVNSSASADAASLVTLLTSHDLEQHVQESSSMHRSPPTKVATF